MKHFVHPLLCLAFLCGAARAQDDLAARSEAEIKRQLAAIERTARQPSYGRTPRASLEQLARLNAYRYLCGVPHDVQLKDAYTEDAAAAAMICEKLGRLDHHPPNPGLDKKVYEQARRGAARCNLHMGRGLDGSVDGFMYDSDPSNIDRVGHRRWCLNPAMQYTGFGEAKAFSAMYSMDSSRKKVPKYDFIAYPPPGFMPEEYFRGRAAWSVSLHPDRYRVPERDDLTVAVTPLKRGAPAAVSSASQKPLALDYLNLDRGGYGVPICIIFRPAGADTGKHKRYRVLISGLRSRGGNRREIAFETEFF